MRFHPWLLCAFLPWFSHAQTILQPAGAGTDEYFGRSVAMDGDWLLASTYSQGYSGLSAGLYKVHAYKKENGTWKEAGLLVAKDPINNYEYGGTLDIHGDYAVLSGPRSHGLIGQAFVFHLENETWTQQATLTNFEFKGGDGFGGPVAVFGNTIAIGATNDGNYEGAVYVFKKEHEAWVEEARLSSQVEGRSNFGHAIAMDERFIAVSSRRPNKVHVFKKDSTAWSEFQTIQLPGGADNPFPISVDIDQERMIVGAPWENETGLGAGSVFVYRWDGAEWKQEQKLTLSNAAEFDYFGMRVTLSGCYAAIEQKSGMGSNTGAVHIFRLEDSIWSEFERFSGIHEDFFANCIDISGNVVVAGAFGSDINGQNFGAVYAYELPFVKEPNEERIQGRLLTIITSDHQSPVQVNIPPSLKVGSIAVLNGKEQVVKTFEGKTSAIDIRGLPKGVYWLSIRFKGGTRNARILVN